MGHVGEKTDLIFCMVLSDLVNIIPEGKEQYGYHYKEYPQTEPDCIPPGRGDMNQ